MRNFTNAEKVNGELACKNLSKKALGVYKKKKPLDVYEYCDENGDKLYAFSGCIGSGYDLDFEELQEVFEDLDVEWF